MVLAYAGLMDNKYVTGQEVTLNSSNGAITLIVVEDLGETILVCRPDEFERASAERRSPVAVGFKKIDIMQKM